MRHYNGVVVVSRRMAVCEVRDRMTDRHQQGHTSKTGPSDFETEAAYTLKTAETQMILSRIRGLFPPEIGDYVEILPDESRVLTELVDRYQEIHMNNKEAENWAESLTHAHKNVFETFVDAESSTKMLNLLLEAEADRDEPRPNRIAKINKRKQEL